MADVSHAVSAAVQSESPKKHDPLRANAHASTDPSPVRLAARWNTCRSPGSLVLIFPAMNSAIDGV